MTLVVDTRFGIPRSNGATPDRCFPDILSWKVVSGTACSVRESNLRLLWADDGGSLSVFTTQDTAPEPTFVLTYSDIARFELSYPSREILISPRNDAVSDHTIQHLLVDQIWPRIIAHCGQLVLHAAGVSTPHGVVLFLGQSGRGKSTLAASLHQRGLGLLGDDAMVISAGDDEARCKAVYRSLRLFPDSIATLFNQPIRQSKVADYTDKRNIHLSVPEHPDDEHRVRAVFFLEPDEAQVSASLRLVSPAAACMLTVEHSFWLDPTEIALTAQKLRSASALANRVPAYRLVYPRDYAKLANVHAAIFSVLD